MIMSLCKNTIHSFLSLTNTSHMDDNNNNNKSLAPPPATSPASIPLFSLPSVFSKKDPGGIGFIDDMGGGVDGLMSCTESLGFESSDERIDHQTEEMDERTTTHRYYDHQALSNNKDIWRKDHHQRHNQEVKKFPPPLSSFNRNGQPSLFLRSVRSDGRLELTEVRIDRPEILRASREDGRLRLHLITEDEDDEVGINSEYNEYEQQDDDDDDEETLEEEEEEEEEGEEEEEEEETLEEEEEERVGEWKLEGFKRCNEVMGPHDYHHHHLHCHHHHQQHSHMHVWSQQCVPTR